MMCADKDFPITFANKMVDGGGSAASTIKKEWWSMESNSFLRNDSHCFLNGHIGISDPSTESVKAGEMVTFWFSAPDQMLIFIISLC